MILHQTVCDSEKILKQNQKIRVKTKSWGITWGKIFLYTIQLMLKNLERLWTVFAFRTLLYAANTTTLARHPTLGYDWMNVLYAGNEISSGYLCQHSSCHFCTVYFFGNYCCHNNGSNNNDDGNDKASDIGESSIVYLSSHERYHNTTIPTRSS